MESEIKERFSLLGIMVTESMIEKFRKYYEMMIDYNNNVNLTAITEKNDVYIKHFLDSVLPYKTIPRNANVCDIGTGAGFPAIPLKIVRPDIKLLLVDCLDKRVKFLESLVSELQLEDVEIVHARAEDIGRDKNHREFYDVAVSRGVAKLNTLSEYCLPLVKVGGIMLAYKSVDIDEELDSAINAITELGGTLEEIQKITIPKTDITRKIVVIKKYDTTPNKYPRGLNKPKLMPIE